MRTFDFIPKYHYTDQEKRRILDAGPAPGEMWILVQDRHRGYWNQVMMRYCPALPVSDITIDWCKKMAEEAQQLSGHIPLRIEVNPARDQKVVYLVKENCYRLFYYIPPAGWTATLEIKHGRACRDRRILAERGIHMYTADLDDTDDVYLNPSVGEDGTPGGGVYLNGWEEYISQDVLTKAYGLTESIKRKRIKGSIIYPPQDRLFRALVLTPPEKVKVVIVGQDPYHGPDEACGLSFSVPEGIKVPPSLKNIFKVLNADIGCNIPTSGDLTRWAERGVLLLNTVLTVEEDKPLSHAKLGWQDFTGAIVEACAKMPQPVVFMLWGGQAIAFCEDKILSAGNKHNLIIRSTHPSPLGANRSTPKMKAFMESRPFSEANEWFEKNNVQRIDWDLNHPTF